MSRIPLIRTAELPYHITARGNNREAFPCSNQTSWRIFRKLLHRITEEHSLKIHAFVLMPNHFHLLLTTPLENVDTAMQILMQSSTKSINYFSERSGRIYGGRYRWSVVDTEGYYDYVLKYIYRNPVKAGICEKVESYKFSSIHSLSDNLEPEIILSPAFGHETLIPCSSYNEYLKWLNEPFSNEDDQSITNGLKKRKFAPPAENWKRNIWSPNNATGIKK